jgi:hypothetical protein
MRLEKKNKRSCIGLLILLGILAGVIVWMSLGGVPAETMADDPAGAIDAIPPPPGKRAPPGTTQQTAPAAAP